jgi:hypothetical protein
MSPWAAVPQTSQSAAAGSNPCNVTKPALTNAISDLDVSKFGPFGVQLGSADPSAGDAGNPAYTKMTQNQASISASMATVGSLLNTTLAKVPGSALGEAVIPYLDGTSGAYEDLIGGDGSFTDEETIVVALSNAVAAALRVCGPSSTVQYAPAQEVAREPAGGQGRGEPAADLGRQLRQAGRGERQLADELAGVGGLVQALSAEGRVVQGADRPGRGAGQGQRLRRRVSHGCVLPLLPSPRGG